MTLTAVLTWAGIVGVLVTLAGVLGAAFRVSRNAQTIANYREAAASWKEKSEAQDELLRDLQGRLAEKDTQIGELQGQMAILRDLATGKSAVEQLAADFGRMAARIEDRVSDALTQSATVRGELKDVRESLTNITATLARRDIRGA